MDGSRPVPVWTPALGAGLGFLLGSALPGVSAAFAPGEVFDLGSGP